MTGNDIIDKLLSEAERLKTLGNSSFASGKFSDAQVMYDRGLSVLQSLFTHCDESYSRSFDVPLEYRHEDKVTLHFALVSNKALVLHKLGRNEDADNLCSHILDHEIYRINADKVKVKLLYRRSQAREALGRFSEAVEDLQLSRDLSRSDIHRTGTKEKNDIENALTRIAMKIENLDTAPSGGGVEDKFQGNPSVDNKIQSRIEKYQSAEKSNIVKGVGVETDITQNKTERSRNAEQTVIKTNISETKINDFSDSMKLVTLPSRIEQREKIMLLLKQSPQSVGEAFFLINFQWWKQWCSYVNFFFDHEYYILDAQKDEIIKNIEDRKKLEMKRNEIVSLLPSGAFIPVKDKSVSTQESSSCSSGSERESNSDHFHLWGAKPGIISNSSLIEEKGNIWSSDLNSRHRFIQEGDIRIRPNSVRGYHFEIIPREVYSALRSWFGEITPRICRRVISVDGQSILKLYPNTLKQDVHLELLTFCDACKSPRRCLFRCSKCSSVYYCGRSCQASHWPYHKSSCQSLQRRYQMGKNNLTHNSTQNSCIEIKRGFYDSFYGKVGLNNLGNTCFMNSALQCLSHATPLTRYFLSNSFANDTNYTNPLGAGGKLAQAYGQMIKEIWMRKQKGSISPTSLKRAIATFAPRFVGVSQHDSQEFLAFLLDGLHEDLNRVKNPPYIERKDVLNLDNLAVAGVEAWDLHCKRNDSLVMDTFYGQFKSTCICPKCDRISTTWDVFNHISLEIPKNLERTIPILLYRTHSESQSSSFPMLYGISMTEGSTILQLKSVLSELCCIPISNIGLCQINENAITDIFQDSKKIPFASGGMVAGYEIIPFSERTSIHVMVTHYVQGDCDLGIETEKFGRPILISFDESYTCHQVRVHIWNQLSYIISPETDQSLFKVLFKTSHSNGKVKSATIPDSDEVFVSFTKEECNKSILSITVDWSSYNERALLEKSRFVSFNEHPSVDLIRSQRPAMDKHLTLDACFKRFINPEVLDESNKWYCSQCKEHVKAMKSMQLWRLPNILIVHLKRFECKHSFRREKIESFVDCPLTGLDLQSYCATNILTNHTFINCDTPAIYDLFAVTNHHGRMGFGHYTAAARRWDEIGMEKEWALFDDSSVSVVRSDAIITPAAYVLFYRRRNISNL